MELQIYVSQIKWGWWINVCQLVSVNHSSSLVLTGNPNASIPTPQPVRPRPMFGAFGAAVGANSVVFVSKVGLRCPVMLFKVIVVVTFSPYILIHVPVSSNQFNDKMCCFVVSVGLQ